jgi:hypothetical protein
MIVYVDDILVLAATRRHCRRQMSALAAQLTRFGWTLSAEKCSTQPQKEIVFLGFTLHLTRSPSPTMSITQQRRRKLLTATKRLLSSSAPPSARLLMSTLGLVQTVYPQSTGGNWVYVLDESGGRALRRAIRLGRQNPRYYEVLEGLVEGDRVVASSYDSFGDADILNLD